MLIRTMDDMEKEGRVVSISHGKATAVRPLTKKDGLGFSVSEARGTAGSGSDLWYKNHWEANYVRSGRGTVQDLASGQVWNLEPGMLYVVGPRDRHHIQSSDGEAIKVISIFNPPIEGDETHDDDGAYPPTGDIPEGPERMFVRTRAEVEAAGLAFSRANGASRIARFVTTADGLGFALSDVNFKAGREVDLWYKNHWEANLVLDGTIEVTHRTTGEVHELGPGALYCVGPDDPHHLRCLTDVHLLSVFNPPLAGDETHDEDGAYPPTGPVPPGPAS
jgi:L-ectoine synthase